MATFASVAGVALAYPALSAGDELTAMQQSAVTSYAKSLGVNAERAERNLREQALGKRLDAALADGVGDSLAGMRFDNANDRWEIGVGPSGDLDAARAAAARAGTRDAVVVRRSFTERELQSASDELWKRLTEQERSAIESTIYPDRGLVVTIDYDAGEDIVDHVQHSLRREIGTQAAHIERGRISAGPGACISTIFCDAPLRAGIKFVAYLNCTSAFSVRSPMNSNRYFLTAGHCLYSPTAVATCPSSGLCPSIGVSNGAIYGGADSGLVLVTSAAWPTSPAWVNWPLGASYPVDTSAPIYDNATAYAGIYYCHTGSRTMTTCGVSASGASTNVAYDPYINEGVQLLPAVIVTGMIKFVNSTGLPTSMCGSEGDSGGPLVNPFTGDGVGIYSGQTRLDPTQDLNTTLCEAGRAFYFEPVVRAVIAHGVEISRT